MDDVKVLLDGKLNASAFYDIFPQSEPPKEQLRALIKTETAFVNQ